MTNTSAASTDPLTITSLSDDNGTPGNGVDDVDLLTAAGVTLHKRGGDADELLESGETWIYTYTKTVPVGEAGEEHVNRVTITASDDEDTEASDTDTATVTYADDASVPEVQTKVLHIEKDATVADGIADEVGDIINYTLTVTHDLVAGSNAAIAGVVVSDPFTTNEAPVLVSGFNIGDTDTDNLLDVSESWNYTASHAVTQDELDAGTPIVNTATATGTNATADTDDAAVPVVQNAALNITKTVDSITNPDDTPSGSTVDQVGDVINYTIKAENTGNVSLTGVTVSDPLLGTLAGPTESLSTNGVLNVGETWTYAASYTATQADIDTNGGGDGDIDNTATADSVQTGPDTASAAVPIIGNDVQNQVSIVATDAVAGETATNNGQFTVSLTQTSSTPTVVSYTLTGSTATAGTDYAALTGSVTIPDGETAATIDVSGIVDDAIVEADETVIVTLTGITSGDPQITLDPDAADRTATVSIADNDSATVSITKITDGAEPSTNGLFRVTQSAMSSTNTVINYSVDGASTATAGSDYTTLSGTVTILAGQTAVDISVPVINDAIVEGTETVVVNLTTFGAHDPDITFDPTPANLTATVDITDNDTNTIAMGPVTVNEAADTMTFTVTQTGTNAVPILLDYATSDGTAKDGVPETGTGIPDYTASTGTVTFAPGTDGTQTFTVPITNDLVVEGSEALTVTLTPQIPSQVSGTSTLVATGTIADNDTATWSISGDPIAIEGGAARYTVRLAGTLQAGETATINMSLTDLDTTSADYADFVTAVNAAIDGRLDLSFDGTTLTYTGNGDPMADLIISVDAIDDESLEVAQDYQVVLSNPGSSTGAAIALGTSAVTTAILDDNERRLTISEGVTQAEGTSLDGFTPYVFTVSLSDVTTTSSVTVDVFTVDGSATTAGLDYQALSNQLVTFAPGETSQTVTVQVRQDDLQESDEYFQVQLSNATNATIAGNVFGNAGIGTITDDDPAPAQPVVRLSEGVTQAEGTSQDGFTPYVFTVNLSGTPTTSDVTVEVTTVDGSATTAGLDYQALSN
ncbi:MAG: Calx-beta domain-containing protein, partial [Actinomycetota bacterium]